MKVKCLPMKISADRSIITENYQGKITRGVIFPGKINLKHKLYE